MHIFMSTIKLRFWQKLLAARSFIIIRYLIFIIRTQLNEESQNIPG